MKLATATLRTLLGCGAAALGFWAFLAAVPQDANAQAPAKPAPAKKPGVNWKQKLAEGPKPAWIWGAAKEKNYTLKKTFEVASTGPARLKATCDNRMKISLNGIVVATSNEWQEPVEFDATKNLKTGTNVLTVEAVNDDGIAAFIAKLAWIDGDGKTQYIVSDATWHASEKGADPWALVTKVAELGGGPWGDVFSNPTSDGLAGGDFTTLPGFEVDKIFTVPKDQMGSWVCITVDPQGRIIASDQGDKGLYRITPQAPGSEEPAKVEKLDVKMTGVQGMLFAFGDFYVCANGGPGSGLYRLRDTNKDDQYDEVVKLAKFNGGGEHGPHGLRLSPDGKRIVVAAGNHTRPPFEPKLSAPIQTMGGARPEPLHAEMGPGQASRLQPNWDEDTILPRQWDANGHATGIVAPGGWIAQTDPEGKTWEILSVGYRNQYDMAYNADGELFVYDSDMEWDMGTPWYRPTRVSHATGGSEFGWRSGTSNWPEYYADSLPALVDIGPGSPVGVEFGYGTKFPAKYQKALYILDWTFGTIYAIHTEPHGSTYKATKEEFLSRTPLPLTDAVVGKDGALYFTVGGRGTQSELFRVRYTGEESTAPVDAKDSVGAEHRAVRKQIEAFHGAPAADPAKAVAFLLPHLKSPDRFLRYAARVGLEWQPLATWQDAVLASSEPEALIEGVVGLARQGNKDLQPKLLAALAKLDWAKLTEFQKLAAVRAYQLVFIRLGDPGDGVKSETAARLDPLFPSPSANLNRELVNLLVFLNSTEVVKKTVPFLTQERAKIDVDLAGVLSRNRGYGGSIAGMLANHPDLQQVHYALALRNAKVGWTVPLKKTYFEWFGRARTWAGGNSYQKFLVNIDKDAYANSTDAERLAVEALGARAPYKAPELPKPAGPGKDWKLDEVLELAKTQLKGRDFKNGQKMFAAARCVVCHRFAGDGGATGPDLTQAAGRFGAKDMMEAIIDPSKVVSDQYKATIVATTDGKQYTGRIVGESPTSITLVADPENASKIVEIKRADIEEMTPSPLSLMPKDLLKTLNEREVLDLLAYLLSRGEPNHPMFRK